MVSIKMIISIDKKTTTTTKIMLRNGEVRKGQTIQVFSKQFSNKNNLLHAAK